MLVLAAKRHGVGRSIQQIARGRGHLYHLIFTQIQVFADSAPVAACGNGVGDLASMEFQCAIRHFDIGFGTDLKHSPFKGDVRVYSGLDCAEFRFFFCNARKGRAGLLDGNPSFDRAVGHSHIAIHDGRRRVSIGDGDLLRCLIQHKSIGRSNLFDRIRPQRQLLALGHARIVCGDGLHKRTRAVSHLEHCTCKGKRAKGIVCSCLLHTHLAHLRRIRDRDADLH